MGEDRQEIEIWKAIPSMPGFEASSLGRVKALQHKNAGGQLRKEKILSGETNHSGYRLVRPFRDGKRHTLLVGRIVCEAFNGPPFDGATVDHVNGDKSDNKPNNLEWVTRAENTRRQNADGRGAPKGEKHPIAKLSDFQAESVVRLKNEGWSASDIAKLLNVSGSLIYGILQGKKRSQIIKS